MFSAFGARGVPTETSRVLLDYQEDGTVAGELRSDGYPLRQTRFRDVFVTAGGNSGGTVQVLLAHPGGPDTLDARHHGEMGEGGREWHPDLGRRGAEARRHPRQDARSYDRRHRPGGGTYG